MAAEDYRASYLREYGDTESVDRAEAPTDEQIVAGFTDGAATAADRIAAIGAAPRDALSRPAVVDALIAVLADRTAAGEVRRAALAELGALSFAVADFAPYTAEYRSALRAAATDPDPALAEDALEVLALGKDDYAQRVLVNGLEDPGAAVISRLRALQFLGNDLHAGQFPMLRRIAEDTGDTDERVAALRLLAADSDSAEMFQRIVTDRTEDTAARTTSAVALNAIDPDAFAATARDIVLDPDDDDDLRAVCLTALAVAPPEVEIPDLADTVLSTPIPPSAELERAVANYRDATSR